MGNSLECNSPINKKITRGWGSCEDYSTNLFPPILLFSLSLSLSLSNSRVSSLSPIFISSSITKETSRQISDLTFGIKADDLARLGMTEDARANPMESQLDAIELGMRQN